MFESGEWAINTKKETVVEIMDRLNIPYRDLYLVEDNGEYYVIDEDSLIEYDKHYFDTEG